MPLSHSKIAALLDDVRQAMAAEGLSLYDLTKSASNVVLFGSRAVGVNRPNSDFDLLIVSDRSGHKKHGRLDLIFVTQAKLNSPLWRRTEIARHIGAFGVSLMQVNLRVEPIIDDYAAMRKQARLHKLTKSLLLHWGVLNGELKRKYLTRVRREIQRYLYLKAGAAAPPTAILDLVLKSPGWADDLFASIGDAAKLSQLDALRIQKLMKDEARRSGHYSKRNRSEEFQKVA